MKKIGKKLSFLTKIMLVIGLLISNLSSLSVVFAYEAPDDVVITKDENNLKIKYTELLAEDVNKVRVDVYESYTYLDDETDTLEVFSYVLDETQMESAKLGELELTHTKSTFKLFDGTYKMVVKFYSVVEPIPELVSLEEEQELPEVVSEIESLESETPEVTEELITEAIYTEEVKYDSGLGLKVYDNNGTELTLNDGRYSVTKEYTEVAVNYSVLTGGLAPSDMFMYNETSYTAEELIEEVFTENYDFVGNIYGKYEDVISLELLKLVVLEENEEETPVEPEYENVTYSTDVKFMYGSYEDNAMVLNSVNTMTETYYFDGDNKDGVLYNYMDLVTGTTSNMLDLYNILKDATDGTEIEYKLFKNDLDLILEYNNTYGNQVEEVSEDETPVPTVTIEEYLEEIEVDGTVKLTLTSGGDTVSYGLVVVGDINNDNLVDEADVDALIELIVADNADLVEGLEGLDGKSVLYLKKVLENKDWNVTVDTEDATLDLELNTDLEETTLVSGDTFKVDYTLKLSTNEVSGFSGKFDYDKESLELLSINPMEGVSGSYDKETGKFFYLGSEALALPEVETEPEPEIVPEGAELVQSLSEGSEPTVVTADYVVLSATFKALKSGTHSVSVKDTEYYNVDKYLNTNSLEVATNVEVTKSDDNTLSYLEVAGVVIELVDGVFEYEVTVKNEVTLVDLKYILSNVAASVVGTVYPEELAEGLNEVTITVVSESGLTQDYKVVVTREEAVKETTTKVNYNNDQPNYQRPEEPEPVTPEEPVEPVEEKESNISKIIIMVLIVLAIGGLVYLIFRDDDDTKLVNKKLNNLKKEEADFEAKNTKEVKDNNKKKPDKNKSNKKKGNNKKER